jgi:hypothetical protein
MGVDPVDVLEIRNTWYGVAQCVSSSANVHAYGRLI